MAGPSSLERGSLRVKALDLLGRTSPVVAPPRPITYHVVARLGRV